MAMVIAEISWMCESYCGLSKEEVMARMRE